MDLKAKGINLPSSYNFKTEYQYCSMVVKSQGYWGSCWAHATATAL